MIEAIKISEIISTYKKHGWILRRVLLSAPLKAKLGGSPGALPAGVPVFDSTIDAAWFSRPPQIGTGVAWEIRYLGNAQYALVETINEDSPDFESALAAVEQRLRVGTQAKISA